MEPPLFRIQGGHPCQHVGIHSTLQLRLLGSRDEHSPRRFRRFVTAQWALSAGLLVSRLSRPRSNSSRGSARPPPPSTKARTSAPSPPTTRSSKRANLCSKLHPSSPMLSSKTSRERVRFTQPKLPAGVYRVDRRRQPGRNPQTVGCQGRRMDRPRQATQLEISEITSRLSRNPRRLSCGLCDAPTSAFSLPAPSAPSSGDSATAPSAPSTRTRRCGLW
jgi:hypothetical protein